MASPLLPTLLFSLSLFFFSSHLAHPAQAQEDDIDIELTSSALDWPTAASAHHPFGDLEEEDEVEVDLGLGSGADRRRTLFWRIRYYISYGALSANRVPCPPRSGRSYYTHNCYRARAPPRPYHRSCSAIARCKR